jgi:cob(I)alamin adenosyltransferase
MKMKKGLVQVYTGDGKGKTTAAIGQGIRAFGRGKTVYMVQFLKSNETGELTTLKSLEPRFSVYANIKVTPLVGKR